jgi:hypothetical protein
MRCLRGHCLEIAAYGRQGRPHPFGSVYSGSIACLMRGAFPALGQHHKQQTPIKSGHSAIFGGLAVHSFFRLEATPDSGESKRAWAAF